jgi:hypothetical protein
MHAALQAVSNSHGQCLSRARATGTYLDPPAQPAERQLHLRSTAVEEDSLLVEGQAGRKAARMERSAAAAAAAGAAA